MTAPGSSGAAGEGEGESEGGGGATGVASRTVLFAVGGGRGGSCWAPSGERALAHELFPDPPDINRLFRCNRSLGAEYWAS